MDEKHALQALRQHSETALAWFIERYAPYVNTIIFNTFIRRLVDRWVLKNDKGTVTSLVSKEAAQDAALSEIICRRFDNSIQSLLLSLDRIKTGSQKNGNNR